MSCLHNKNIERQYDAISYEFDTTRTRIWTSVQDFLKKHQYISIYPKTLLDVGVGNGKNIIFANSLQYDCIGIDISNNLLDICKKKDIRVRNKDVLNLDESFGKFDTIISIATIHHLENIDVQKQAIINMIDCLKNNGHLLISVWSHEIFDSIGKNKNDYRKFNVGCNLVEWNSKNSNGDFKSINRFYYIHNYDSFQKMFQDIAKVKPISYEIKWEKQNWFCEIHKL